MLLLRVPMTQINDRRMIIGFYWKMWTAEWNGVCDICFGDAGVEDNSQFVENCGDEES